MGTNIKGILLTEVNRMREIMGMNIINEQKGLGVIKKLLGVSDESVELISKGNADDLGQYSSSLKNLVGGSGTGSLSDITNFLSKKGIGTSEDAIASWIKSQPEIMGQIAKSSDSIMKQASEIVFNKLKLTNIFDQKSIDAITNTLKLSLDDEFSADSIIIRVDGALSSLRKVLAERGKNAEVEDLIKKLEDKKKIAQNYKSPMDATSPLVKSVDNVVSGGKSEMLKVLDELEESEGKALLTNIVNKATDEEIKFANDIASKIPKGSEEELISTIKNKFCSVKESNGNFQGGCSKVTAFLKIFDPKGGRPVRAVIAILITIAVTTMGVVALYDLIGGFFNWRESGYDVNPYNDDSEDKVKNTL